MKKALRGVYYFLPVQLLLLHFRKYQLLLGFWLLLVLVITGNFASHFGASSLFLAPEYIGQINFMSMFLLGAAMCVFTMTWHITTFIVHSKRMPYMGATRHSFVVYCYNNSIIPLAFLVFYSIVSFRFQYYDEHSPVAQILWLQLGFYLGFGVLILVSFAYFFRVSRDFFKTLLSRIAKPERIRSIIPYDSLDYEIDYIPAKSFISGDLKIEKSEDLAPYHPRVIDTVLRRHHRNVIFAAFFSYILLLLMGRFMEQPLLRVPAGAGFLLLFSIFMGFVGAFKYFLKSWEAIGWVVFVCILSLLVKYKLFDLRSIAYGMNYTMPAKDYPTYDYESLKTLFTPQKFAADRELEEKRLDKWKYESGQPGLPSLDDTTSMVVVTTSGGGSRSAYWTFRALQYVDSLSKGKLFKHTVLITGASGGMIGASYWRNVHDAVDQKKLKAPYDPQYQANIGKDLLNAIIFSLASVDLISPINKVKVRGYSYTRDRGYAMEQELVSNTDGLMDHAIGYYKKRESDGIIPQLFIGGTIVNDGRKLIICNQPIGYMTQPEYSLQDSDAPIDAVEYSSFFAKQDPSNLSLTSALRMNATFPFVLPVVRLPSQPYMNIMDAGMRDNFGTELASRYLYVMRKWIDKNIKNVIFLEIRDTKENDVAAETTENTLTNMLMDPLFVIQNKWEAFQSYKHSFLKDYAPYFLEGKLHYVTLSYVPTVPTHSASLNFHITKREKEDLAQSIYNPGNQAAIKHLLYLLH